VISNIRTQKFKKVLAEKDVIIADLQTNLSKKEKLADKYKCEFAALQGTLVKRIENMRC